MKKGLIILALIAMLALAACGGDKPAAPAAEPAPVAEPAPAAPETPAPAPESGTTPSN